MLLTTTVNVCIRCGKDRIFFDSFIDNTIPTLPMKVSNFVCPDANCQKVVDSELAEKRRKRLLLIQLKTVKKIAVKVDLQKN